MKEAPKTLGELCDLINKGGSITPDTSEDAITADALAASYILIGMQEANLTREHDYSPENARIILTALELFPSRGVLEEMDEQIITAYEDAKMLMRAKAGTTK